MPLEDNSVEVLVISHATESGASSEASPIEMGGQGKLVQLLGIHYICNTIATPPGAWHLCLGLSSNPNHLLNPPAGREPFIRDISIYGSFIHLHRAAGDGTSHSLSTAIIPLYGLIRPRRQIFVIRADTTTAIEIRVEVYYRPIAIQGIIRNVIDRKFGKYRRS